MQTNYRPRHYSLVQSYQKFLNVKYRQGFHKKSLIIISPALVSFSIIFNDNDIVIIPLDNLSGPPIYLGMPDFTSEIIKALFDWELFPINKITYALYFKSLVNG